MPDVSLKGLVSANCFSSSYGHKNKCYRIVNTTSHQVMDVFKSSRCDPARRGRWLDFGEQVETEAQERKKKRAKAKVKWELRLKADKLGAKVV